MICGFMTTKKTIIIIAAAIVIIAGVAAFYDYSRNGEISSLKKVEEKSQERTTVKTENQGQTDAVGVAEGGFVETDTKKAVPKDIKVPEEGEALTEAQKDIAVPEVVTSAAPGVSAKFRKFTIKAEGDKFSPSKVIVNKGDTVHIDFTAVDKEYDITFPDYGMKQTAPKDQTKILEFQAVAEGQFLYYCDSCGGLDSEARGYIIVAQE